MAAELSLEDNSHYFPYAKPFFKPRKKDTREVSIEIVPLSVKAWI